MKTTETTAGKYSEAFNESIKDPSSFWERAAQEVAWKKPYDQVLDDSKPPFYKWFPGGELNTCYNALDLHIEKGLAIARRSSTTAPLPIRSKSSAIRN